jgi:hypothetical protein
VILKGAVMAFQSEHNMTINGEMSSALWNALLRAASLGQNNLHRPEPGAGRVLPGLHRRFGLRPAGGDAVPCAGP